MEASTSAHRAEATSPPFPVFVELIRQLSGLEKPRGTRRDDDNRALDTLYAWTDGIRRQYTDPDKCKHFARMFFPDEGVRRRYDMQEKTLIKHLSNYLNIDPKKLNTWSRTDVDGVATGTGCLGLHVRNLLKDRDYKPRFYDDDIHWTWKDMDERLDHLASKSCFSAQEVKDKRPAGREFWTRDEIIGDLFKLLDCDEIAVMIQIILRDIDPLLYPREGKSAVVALTLQNTKSFHRITLQEGMLAWHPRLFDMYRITKNLDYVCDALAQNAMAFDDWRPRVGLQVDVPKSARPEKCSAVAKRLEAKGDAAVETKYDGERLQVHIDLSKPFDDQITIFSKSGRESTEDRRVLKPIIRAAFGMSNTALVASSKERGCAFSRNIIVEGEMVPYNEDERRIDEYWKIQSLKPTSPKEKQIFEDTDDDVETGDTQLDAPRADFEIDPPSRSLHLAIVWFDILQVDDVSLLESMYQVRRAKLVDLVRCIDGFSFLAERKIIDFSQSDAEDLLRAHFAKVVTERGEGVMIKVTKSRYHDEDAWHKLKKDFIPGLGDTKDFYIIGASWRKERGRTLSVPPSVYTTFFVGLKAPDLAPRSHHSRPHYYCHFVAQYGLTRDQLLNVMADKITDRSALTFHPDFEQVPTEFRKVENVSRDGVPLPTYRADSLSYTFTLAPYLDNPSQAPSCIFKNPLVFELTGAGFQKPHGSPDYELRWPRITKASRIDGEPMDLEQMEAAAKQAMRADATSWQEQVDEWWAGPKAASKKETPRQKYKRELREWVWRLEQADGLHGANEQMPDFGAQDDGDDDDGDEGMADATGDASAWNVFRPAIDAVDPAERALPLDELIKSPPTMQGRALTSPSAAPLVAPGRRFGPISRLASIVLAEDSVEATQDKSPSRTGTEIATPKPLATRQDESPSRRSTYKTPDAQEIKEQLLELMKRSAAPSPPTDLGRRSTSDEERESRKRTRIETQPSTSESGIRAPAVRRSGPPAAGVALPEIVAHGPSTAPRAPTVVQPPRPPARPSHAGPSRGAIPGVMPPIDLEGWAYAQDPHRVRWCWTTVPYRAACARPGPVVRGEPIDPDRFRPAVTYLESWNYMNTVVEIVTLAKAQRRTGYIFVEHGHEDDVRELIEVLGEPSAQQGRIFMVSLEEVEARSGGQRAIDDAILAIF